MERHAICVIDDDANVRQTICTILETAGCATAEASDGEQGLEAIARTGATIAVVDIIMPNREGLETIAEAKTRFPSLKILAVSGSERAIGSQGYLALAKAIGADDVLRKPLRAEELLARVKRLVDGDRLATQ